jgi:hypothetical protein
MCFYCLQDKKGGVEKSIAYKGIDNNAFKGGASSIASMRRAKREMALHKSRIIITKLGSVGSDTPAGTSGSVSGRDEDDDEYEPTLTPKDSAMSVSLLRNNPISLCRCSIGCFTLIILHASSKGFINQ